MSILTKRNYQIGIVCAIIAAALWLLYSLPLVFNPFLLALALAYILNPLIRVMEQHGIPRRGGIGIVFLGLLVAFLTFSFIVVPAVLSEASLWRVQVVGEPLNDKNKDGVYTPGKDSFTDENGNGMYDEGFLIRLTQRLKSTSPEENPLRRLLLRITTPEKATRLQQDVITSIRSNASEIGTELGGILSDAWSNWLGPLMTKSWQGIHWAINLLMLLILTPIYLAFLLNSLPDGWAKFVSYIPGAIRPRVLEVLHKIDLVLAAFFRGRLLVCSSIGIFTALGFWMCGVRFGLLFGMMIGMMSFIPFLNILGLIPALISCWMEGFGVGGYAIVLVVYGIGQALDPLLSCLVMGKDLQLHPVTILLSMFACASLFGFLGMLLAIPLVASAKILCHELLMPHLIELANEPESTFIRQQIPPDISSIDTVELIENETASKKTKRKGRSTVRRPPPEES